MAGIIKIEITESTAELLEQLKSAQNQDVKERIQTLYWLKTKQVESTGAIASLRWIPIRINNDVGTKANS